MPYYVSKIYHTFINEHAIYHSNLLYSNTKLLETSRGFFWKLYTMVYNIKKVIHTKNVLYNTS